MAYFDQLMLSENSFLDDCVIGTYLFETDEKDAYKKAAAMASEQSTGTWLRVPGEDADMLAKYEGKVVNVFEIPDIENVNDRTSEMRTLIIQLAFPWNNFGAQMPMLFTTVFGNISGMGKIKLLDIHFPKECANQYPGPKFGIKGLRKLLGVEKRPLLNNMIKPSTGIPPEKSAELLYNAAVGGADIMKDDEVMGDRDFSPALKRLEACMKAIKRVEEETGEKKLYCLNITDDADRCIKKAHDAIDAGANALMVNYLTLGFGTMCALARDKKINVPILAHLDHGGAFYGSPWHGMSSNLIYGKLARLSGIDMLAIPTPYGKFALSHEKYMKIILGLRSKFHDVKPTFPLTGGAIKQPHLPQFIEELGYDFIIGAGGAIHGHPMGSTAGSKSFRQGLDLMMTEGNLDRASEFPELKVAMEKWG
ncbi:MAG: ribulose 1,5-bisphosphate carboxylase [Fibrobacteria bacterium]|nr:ribulose 1,5-bisphosphate carboxylase [Fibrobacteria bacterium]